MCAAKGPCLLQVKVLSGKLSVRPGSYRGGEEGNRIAEALGTRAHHGWVCESTGRNASEARAGLERDVVSADLPFEDRRCYLLNAYRVLLTRARQGMIVFVPPGDPSDPTRAPSFYDDTYQHLIGLGVAEV